MSQENPGSGAQHLVLRTGAVMPGLRPVEVVALRIAAFLLAWEAGAEPSRRGRRGARHRAVALAVGPVRLVLAPVGLRLLFVDVS